MKPKVDCTDIPQFPLFGGRPPGSLPPSRTPKPGPARRPVAVVWGTVRNLL
ncbi:hypothetical protein [Hymenobacter sp. UV11]|uniref:hypothetical protein n=1 Tax=Hymenobacter sp. UV11 TaxID=1849735 RepID=UPI0014152BB6|nr:hypothetical protein [Hymenobacter sp. UV11]